METQKKIADAFYIVATIAGALVVLTLCFTMSWCAMSCQQPALGRTGEYGVCIRQCSRQKNIGVPDKELTPNQESLCIQHCYELVKEKCKK